MTTGSDPAQYPGADPGLLSSGSLVFFPTGGPVDLRDVAQWWRYTPGRPAARKGEAVDTSTAHLGFRCVVREQGQLAAG